MERIVHRQLSDYLEKHNLLNFSQFGFRPRRSTELACTLLLDDIRKNMDTGLLRGVNENFGSKYKKLNYQLSHTVELVYLNMKFFSFSMEYMRNKRIKLNLRE